MKNMNDYYAARDAENEAILQGEDGDDIASDRSDSEDDVSDDAYLSDDYLKVKGVVDTRDILGMVDDTGDTTTTNLLRTLPSPSMFPSRIREVLQAVTYHDLVGHIASCTVNSERATVALSQPLEGLRKWV
jgi:hypothetical protein